jgi:Uma2 family endonuclease
MATGTQVSLDEYLSTTYDSDCEYVDGELIERNVGELDHSGIQGVILAILYNQRREAGIHVPGTARSGQVRSTRFRVPDITVTTHKCKGRILREPPFLCIEVLSPEDRATRMEAKIDDYLAFGVKYVWVIDPRTETAWIYTSEGKRHAAEALTTSNPDLTVTLKEIFDALAEDIEP